MTEIEDPTTPLEHLPPVELIEVDEPGEEPPPEWGQQGQGDDVPEGQTDGE